MSRIPIDHRTHSSFTRLTLACIIFGLTTATVQPADPVSGTPQLTRVTKGRIGIGIPVGWKEVAATGSNDVLGFWTVDGKNILGSTGAIVIGTAKDADIKLNLKDVALTSEIETTVGGKPARRIEMQDKGDKGGAGLPGRRARGIGLVLKDPGPDGKHIVFVFLAAAENWDKLGPQFEAAITSITIDGKGGDPAVAATAGTVTVMYLDRGQDKPLVDATVIVGRRLYLLTSGVGSAIDEVRGEATVLRGTTNDKGAFNTAALPPGSYDVTVWKAGHIPVQNVRLNVPGSVKVYVNPDSGVGSTGRHRTLDTSKIFEMKPPNPATPVVWGRITLGTRPTASPNSEPVAGDNVTILIGENLSLQDTGLTTLTDVVRGEVIYAEVTTNADGTFAVPVPTGTYSLQIWKKGYTPQVRATVSVWPGQVFYTLLKDDGVGGTARHQNLDTTGQNIPRKKLEPKAGIRGTVRLSDSGVRTPGQGVSVLVGTGLRLDLPIIPGPSDKVIGTRLIAQTQTDKNGEFFIAIPPGTYQLISWKEGCIPQVFDTVVVPPGVYNVTLSVDNQPGSSGRHQRLDLSGVQQTPPGGGVNPAMAPLLPFIFGASPSDSVPRTAGNVSLSVPEEWRKDLDTPADEGAWLTGKADTPDTYFAVMRDISFDRLSALIAPSGTPTTISGRLAKSCSGVLKGEPGVRAALVVLNDPEPDGRRIALFAKAPETLWERHATTFNEIFESVKITTTKVPVPPVKPVPPPVKPVPPLPPDEDLKEVTRVSRIPDFTAAFAYTAYEDRVAITDAAGKVTVIGVAGSGKSLGAGFRTFLESEKQVAAVLGEAVSLEISTLGNTLGVQLFRGGALVKEKASGKVWWSAHTQRPRDLRPADEIIRYPMVMFNKSRYEVGAYPGQVRIMDPAAKVSMGVKVGTPGETIPEAFRKVLDADKLEPSIGLAVSGVEPLFDTAGRIQVYEGGVLIVLPGTNQYWWCRHPRRGPTINPPSHAVTLPKDPNTVVVRLDYVGGYTPPRKTNEPCLQIRADGRVTLIDPFGKQKPVEAKLDPENVLVFLKFAVEEKRFFAVDSVAMERGIKSEAQRLKLPTILDMPTTAVTIRTADKVHEARCYAPEFYAEKLPQVKGVQDFQAVHKRLVDYMEKLRGP